MVAKAKKIIDNSNVNPTEENEIMETNHIVAGDEFAADLKNAPENPYNDLKTTSARIRAIYADCPSDWSEGKKRKHVIDSFMKFWNHELRYQHCRNILVQPVKKA